MTITAWYLVPSLWVMGSDPGFVLCTGVVKLLPAQGDESQWTPLIEIVTFKKFQSFVEFSFYLAAFCKTC